MADDLGVLSSFGIRVASLFAGFAGGLVGAWADEKASVGAWLACMFCGGLTANFLSLDATHFLPSWVSEGGIGFAIGLGAYPIARTIKGLVSSWRPQFGGK